MTPYKLSLIDVDRNGVTATFYRKAGRWMSSVARRVPDDYTLPDWAQERLALLAILPVHPVQWYVEIDGIGYVNEFEQKRRRYTVLVPDEHAAMWGELTDEA